MNDLITKNDINNLGTFNDTFPALSHYRLTLYSIGDKQGLYKTDDLPQQFGLLHNNKQITKRLVFWCFPITFA